LPELPRLTESCLSQDELIDWSERPRGDRLRCFYRYWTCKEAILKATGDGLNMPPRLVRLPRPPQLNELSVAEFCDVGVSDRFIVSCFSPRPGYVAAVAYEDSAAKLRRFHISQV
jgi:4'-phosphopantetheinyl transferase